MHKASAYTAKYLEKALIPWAKPEEEEDLAHAIFEVMGVGIKEKLAKLPLKPVAGKGVSSRDDGNEDMSFFISYPDLLILRGVQNWDLERRWVEAFKSPRVRRYLQGEPPPLSGDILSIVQELVKEQVEEFLPFEKYTNLDPDTVDQIIDWCYQKNLIEEDIQSDEAEVESPDVRWNLNPGPLKVQTQEVGTTLKSTISCEVKLSIWKVLFGSDWGWRRAKIEGKMNSDLGLLQTLHAALRALHQFHWTCHWQSAGPASFSDHMLFERLYLEVVGEIDGLAEKLVGFHGAEGIDSGFQLQVMAQLFQRWSDVEGDLADKATQAEEDVQFLVLRALGSKVLSPGMENFLQGISDLHETHTYLLRQRVTPSSHLAKLRSLAQ